MAIYYVSRQNGNDANSGATPALAKATIGAGLALMSSGDTLYIGPGIYRETFTDSDFTAGTLGNETKIIGDPDCKYLTNDNSGIVRVTGCDSSDIPTSGVVWDSYVVAYLWVKNLHIDGSSSTYTVQASDETQLWENCVIQGYRGVQGDFADTTTFINCLILATDTAANSISTVSCVVLSGNQVAVIGGYHIGTIVFGKLYGFQNCYDESFEGSVGFRGGCYNCLAINSSGYGFYNCSGYNCMSLGGFGGFFFGITNGGRQMIGGISAHASRGAQSIDGSYTYMGSGDSLMYGLYNAALAGSPTNGGTVNAGKHIEYGINTLHHIRKAFEPLLTSLSGSVDANLTSIGLRAQSLTNPFISSQYEGTSGSPGGYDTWNDTRYWNFKSLDAADKPVDPNNLITPGVYSAPSSQSLDFINTSGSEFGIRIDGYGGTNFSMPISSSQPFTASVAVKYNVTSAPPKMMISSSLPSLIESDFTPLEAQAVGTGDQTGTWQTLTITGSSPIDNILNIQLLQADGHPTGSSFAIFSNLQVNE